MCWLWPSLGSPPGNDENIATPEVVRRPLDGQQLVKERIREGETVNFWPFAKQLNIVTDEDSTADNVTDRSV